LRAAAQFCHLANTRRTQPRSARRLHTRLTLP
jgi:hypothetical protein